MRDQNFDDLIKNKLSGLDNDTHSSDWSDFEQLLDADQISDNLIDEKVSYEMNKMRSPYRHDHWNMLHDSLEFQRERNYKIIGYKIIEFSLVFLLLLSGYNFYDHLPTTFQVEKPQIYASDNVEEDQKIKDSTSDIELAMANLSVTPIASVNDEVVANNKLEEATAYQLSSVNSTHTTVNPRKPNTVESMDALHAITINHDLISNSIVATSHDEDKSMLASTIEPLHSFNLNLAVVPTLDIKALSTIDNTPTPNIKSIIDPLDNINSNKSTWLTAYASFDNNLVSSPYDIVYNQAGYETYGLGYSVGAEIARRVNDIEVGIGIKYSNRAYDPRYHSETFGSIQTSYYEVGLKRIEFDVLSIPLNLKYTVYNTPSWKVDIGVGASASLISHTDYDVELRRLDTHNRGTRFDYDLYIDQKSLYPGLFQGGTLSENLFLTTDFSVGVEKEISSGNYLSIRPQYSLHTLSGGVGPNDDHIHNLSLSVGVKHIL